MKTRGKVESFGADTNERPSQDLVIDLLASDPVGPTAGRFWMNTTDGKIKFFDGSSTRVFASVNELNEFGRLVGHHDASTGVPLTGSGKNEITGAPDGSIEAGDYWRVSAPGTIVGVIGDSPNFVVGDVMLAIIDDAATPANFLGMQSNIDVATTANFYTESVVLGAAAGVVNINHNLNNPRPSVTAYDQSTLSEVSVVAKSIDTNNVSVEASGSPITIDITVIG